MQLQSSHILILKSLHIKYLKFAFLVFLSILKLIKIKIYSVKLFSKKLKKYTVLKSPFVYKKARNQYAYGVVSLKFNFFSHERNFL